jgi:acetoin utilization deacetylase AcuC-like enzyme
MRMTATGYAHVIASLRDVATRHGALALVTEGGYELAALARCLQASVEVLDGAATPMGVVGETARGTRACTLARGALSPYWGSL